MQSGDGPGAPKPGCRLFLPGCAVTPPDPPRPCSFCLALLASGFPERGDISQSRPLTLALPGFPAQQRCCRWPHRVLPGPFPPTAALRESMRWACQLCLHNTPQVPTVLTPLPPTAAALARPPPRRTCGSPRLALPHLASLSPSSIQQPE